MKLFARLFPWLMTALGAAYLLAHALPRGADEGEMDLAAAGQIPVVDRGRVKPLDTVARVGLAIISDKQSFYPSRFAELDDNNDGRLSRREFIGPDAGTPYEFERADADQSGGLSFAEYCTTAVDERGERQPAIRWLLDVMSDRSVAERHRVFRIENDGVLGLLGLRARAGFRYAIDEFGGHIQTIVREAQRATAIDEGDRDLFDTKIIELANQLQLFVDLASHETPLLVPPRSSGDEWHSVIEASGDAMGLALAQLRRMAERAGGPQADMSDQELLAALEQHEELYNAFVGMAHDHLDPAAQSLDAILQAYADNDADEFNLAVARYHADLRERVPEDALAKARFETFFNHFSPFAFTRAPVLYLLAFLLACFAWLGWTRPLAQASIGLIVVAVLAHAFGLVGRMYLQDRWLVFVTNLYSSALFIGFATVLTGLVLEWIYGRAIGAAVAGLTGFGTLIIAGGLGGEGDTLEMMQAVLDTNFWLATHVTTVTFGYAATFLAGFLGILYIVLGTLTRALDKDAQRALSRMIYGVVCFATLLSFVGTMLGGVWADVSWGRFWGWDPKENGAIIIVIWNALMLHARWAGMVQQRGLAVLAVVGNIVTSWSWFGTNMLGVGLHSYGFMGSAVFWLLLFIGSQLAIVALGLIPKHLWRSYDVLQRPPQPRQSKGRERPAREEPPVVAVR